MDNSPAVYHSQFRHHLEQLCRNCLFNLLTSEDWVDVLMGLSLINEDPDLYEANEMLNELENSTNKDILKEVQIIRNKQKHITTESQRIDATEISLGKKILLLKEIEIFSGLSAAELATILAEPNGLPE